MSRTGTELPATWRALPAGEADRVVELHNDLIDELTASGELVGIHRLADHLERVIP